MVGADGAGEVLAKPVDGTLFFAGEATASPESNGTLVEISHGQRSSGCQGDPESPPVDNTFLELGRCKAHSYSLKERSRGDHNTQSKVAQGQELSHAECAGIIFTTTERDDKSLLRFLSAALQH